MANFAVVLGMSPTGLYAIRELGREGVPVVGLDMTPTAGRWSRYLSFDERRYVAKSHAEALEWLRDLGECHPGEGVLIPTSDEFIELVSENAASLREVFRFQHSYDRTFYRKIVDKARFYELCGAHGVAAPALWKVRGDEFSEIASDVSIPCIVKPTLIHQVRNLMAGRKVFVAREREDVRNIGQMVGRTDSEWLIQEIIPGPESNITLFGGYFSREGKLHQAFTCVKARQYPPGFGSASLVRARDLPETLRLSRDFLQAVGFQGIAGAEFKFDPRDGRLKMIEVNPRPTLWFGASHAAGKRITLAAFRDQTDLSLPQERAQVNDVAWRFLLKDIYSKIWYRFNRGSSVLPPPDLTGVYPAGVRRTVGAVWDANDPAPVLAEVVNYSRKFLSRLGSR